MIDLVMQSYWNDIPVGKANKVTYFELANKWDTNIRHVRKILSELSMINFKDGTVLIRSSKNKGFYRTTSPEEITAYISELERKALTMMQSAYICRVVVG